MEPIRFIQTQWKRVAKGLGIIGQTYLVFSAELVPIPEQADALNVTDV